MRSLCWFMSVCWLAAGCHYFERPGILVDDPNERRLPGPSSKSPPLADRDAVSMGMPLGVRLTMTVEQPGRESFSVERRLAELGVHRAINGALVDARGNLVYDLPRGVPFNDKPLTRPDLMHVNQAEVKKFVEAILLPEAAAEWRKQGQPLQITWSPQKGEFDRLVLNETISTEPVLSPPPPVR